MDLKSNFSFGKNWRHFLLDHLDEERIQEAIRSLINFCGEESIKGKTFIDVGSGSGLFSFAAQRIGASRILSFDNDEVSVECCNQLRKMGGSHSNWDILTGSILDQHFVKRLGQFDFVYAWGTLHHTGDMWRALSNTCRLVSSRGFLYLSLYNRADSFAIYSDGRFGSSRFWSGFKHFYALLPGYMQSGVACAAMGFLIIFYLATLRNPCRMIKSHRQLRGMSWEVDIRDWLGGYPYEYAKVDEVFNFVKKYGFTLVNLHCHNNLRANEYLFQLMER